MGSHELLPMPSVVDIVEANFGELRPNGRRMRIYYLDDLTNHFMSTIVYVRRGANSYRRHLYRHGDNSLGRINVLSVPFPHNDSSWKARTSQAEEVLAVNVKLCKDGENTCKDHDVDVPSSNSPGVVADDR